MHRRLFYIKQVYLNINSVAGNPDINIVAGYPDIIQSAIPQQVIN